MAELRRKSGRIKQVTNQTAQKIVDTNLSVLRKVARCLVNSESVGERTVAECSHYRLNPTYRYSLLQEAA